MPKRRKEDEKKKKGGGGQGGGQPEARSSGYLVNILRSHKNHTQKEKTVMGYLYLACFI